MQHRSDTVVIIGGGVAGLAAGCLLARNGFAVQLFEANNKLGGCCATTTVDGYTFNDGAVYLAFANVLDYGFAKLGLIRTDFLPLRKIRQNCSAILLDGTVVTIGEGLDVRVEGRGVDVDRLRGELHGMVAKWKPVLRFAGEDLLRYPFSAWRVLRNGWRYLYKLRGTVEHWLPGVIVCVNSRMMIITAWYVEHGDEAGIILLNDFAVGDYFGGGLGFQETLREQGFVSVRNLATPAELEEAKTPPEGKKAGMWSGPWLAEYPWEAKLLQ